VNALYASLRSESDSSGPDKRQSQLTFLLTRLSGCDKSPLNDIARSRRVFNALYGSTSLRAAARRLPTSASGLVAELVDRGDELVAGLSQTCLSLG